MKTRHNIRLTSSEITQLWAAYMNDSLAVCVLEYFVNKVEDTEIHRVLEYALELSSAHIKKISKILQSENYPIPIGFDQEQDVDVNAPRLYSDTFFLTFIRQMGQLGMNAYSLAVSLSTRDDVYDYFSECLSESNKLHKMACKVLLSKGLYIRPPYLPTPDKADFVQKQKFLTGWFGERRPITGIEIAHLFANTQRNALGIATLLGFAQTAKSKEVKQYMVRGSEISSKHVEVFSSILRENDLSAPMTWNTNVMDSTTYVFSDKLMMFQVAALNGIGIGYYGAGMGTSLRRDLGAHYARLIAEVGLYAEDGTNMMINNGWLERPPQATDREELINI